jgi:hypothetical protein
MLPNTTVQDFKEKKAPGIKRYKGESEEGYMYVHVVNEEKEATFNEKVNFTKFEGLELLKP